MRNRRVKMICPNICQVSNELSKSVCQIIKMLFVFFSEFESRFNFNTDFPQPEPYRDTPKNYPSKSSRATTRSEYFFIWLISILSISLCRSKIEGLC